MRKLVYFIPLFLLAIGNAKAQNRFFTGFFPEVSITKKLNETQRLNFKVENQNIIYDNEDPASENPQFTPYRLDFMGFFDHSLRPGMSVAIGLFHRFQEAEDGNRIIQQLSLLQKSRVVRLNHRFRTDQTFTRNQPLEVRFRYRLSVEIPLEGTEIDPGEFYLLNSAESIFSYQGDIFDIENRLVCSLGKFFSKKEKLEWGVDYRTDKYIQEGFRTRLWARLSYYYNF